VKGAWRGALTLAAVATAGYPGAVLADSGRVALVRPTAPDPTIAEALNRIRGELVAEGFDVVLTDASTSTDDVLSADPQTVSGAGSVATIALSVDEGTHVAQLRVIDRLTNKVVIRRAPVGESEAPHAAEVLAVRAVELLRASLLELLVESEKPAAKGPKPAPAEVRHASRWAARALPGESELAWGVELGVGGLADFGGVPPAVLGVARLRRTLVGPLALRVTVAGLGASVRAIQSAAGSATVQQDFGLLEAVLDPWSKAPVHPVLSLGAGALYVAVDGQPSQFQYASRQPDLWAFAGDVGLGAELHVGRHFDLSLDAHALVATPYPVVEVLRSEVARTGQPAIFGSLSVVGRL
jgi:hypothetical protein